MHSELRTKIRQMQSWPKHSRKSSDLRCRLKAVNYVDEATLDSRLFHTREAATGNARSKIQLNCVQQALISARSFHLRLLECSTLVPC